MSNQGKEITEELRNEAIDEINAAREAAGIKEKIEYTDTRNVGNNGYSPNQGFHLTGIASVVTVDVANGKAVYPALETEEGIWLSLARLMGITSLKGYKLNESVENWVRPTRTVKEPIKEIVTAEVAADFNAEDFDQIVWKPTSRDLYTEYATLKSNPDLLKGKIATYKGVVVRQIVAKKDSKVAENGWKKGDKRAMTAQLWSIE